MKFSLHFNKQTTGAKSQPLFSYAHFTKRKKKSNRVPLMESQTSVWKSTHTKH